MTPYPNLFSPIEIGNVTVRNRLLQTGHTKLFSQAGHDTARNTAYHVERAKGGIGLIITGNRFVHPTSMSATLRYSYAWRREAIPFDRQLTDAVHEHGAVIVAQLNHFGVNGVSDAADDLRVLWGPSALKSPEHGEKAKAMEIEDIREVTDWWARSAEYSREGGFDGVEVHISHSYLLHQFLSPLYNKRTDEYGGSLENRMRFALEVIDEVRSRVGNDFVVGVRMSLTDIIDGALGMDDAIRVAGIIEHTGKIDYINLTAGGYHDGLAHAVAPSDMQDGWLVDLVAQLKTHVTSLPVFAVGGLKDPAQAEDIIASGKADMVAMTRGQIADPFLPNKAREGRENEIYHCIRGNQGCIARDSRALPIGCTVNPAAGREARFGEGKLEPASPPGHWVVVGGGPAGMKAAETLAKRGHTVTLLEKEAELGGQVNLILRTPGRESFGWITRDLTAQMRRHGVDVFVGQEATPEVIRELAPDGVILATGAIADRNGFSSAAPLVDRLPGVDGSHVLSSWDVLLETRPVGEFVVVADDEGTRHTAGVAEVLLDQGKQVEIVSRFPTLFPGTTLTLDMPLLYERLFAKGLTYRLNEWVREIREDSVETFNLYTGVRHVLTNVDTVVLVTSPHANDDLYFELKGTVNTLHRIGDCVAPRRIDHAIYEGFLAGCELWAPEARYIIEGDLENLPAAASTAG